MASDQLAVKIVVDSSQLASGMSQAVTTVSTAADRMAQSLKQSGLSAAEASSAMKNLGFSAKESSSALAGAGMAAQEAAAGFTAAGTAAVESGAASTRSLTEARLAAQLLGHEIGVSVPRAMTTVLARSTILGPALNAAFSGVALAGFIELAVVAAEKLSTLISDTYLFTQAQKDLGAQIVKSNQEIERLNEEHQKNLRDIAVIGLPLLQQEKMRAEYAKKDAADLESTKASKQQELKLETDKLNALEAQRAKLAEIKTISVPKVGDVQVSGPDSAAYKQLSTQIDAQDEKVKKLNDDLGLLNTQYRNAGDGVQAASAKFKAEAIKEHAKQMEAARRSVEEYSKAIEHLKLMQEGLTLSANSLAIEQQKFGEQVAVEAAKKDEEGFRARLDADTKFHDAREADAQQAALAEIAVEEVKVQELLRIGKISESESVRQLNDLEKQKRDIELAYLNARAKDVQERLLTDDAKAYAADLAEWSKLLSAKQKAEEKYNLAIQKNDAASAVANHKVWEQAFNNLQRTFDGVTTGLINGTERFGTAFAHAFDQMAANFVRNMERMVTQWVLSHVFMTAFKKTEDQKQALTDAKAAFRGAYKAVVGIPYIGPILAPIAGATAFAAVEAFSAADGMVVPNDNALSVLHKNEMVLPAHIAQPLTSAIQGGNIGGGGSSQVHAHFTINAIDSSGFERLLHKNEAAIVATLTKAMRKRNL